MRSSDWSLDVCSSDLLFGQIEQELTDELLLAGSARVDFHSEYGTRFSPRLSALYRPGPWTIRASFGKGFYEYGTAACRESGCQYGWISVVADSATKN